MPEQYFYSLVDQRFFQRVKWGSGSLCLEGVVLPLSDPFYTNIYPLVRGGLSPSLYPLKEFLVPYTNKAAFLYYTKQILCRNLLSWGFRF